MQLSKQLLVFKVTCWIVKWNILKTVDRKTLYHAILATLSKTLSKYFHVKQLSK